MVLLLTGCPEDAADIVEYKATILNFDVAPVGDALLLTGDVSVDRLLLVDFDTSVADAFVRATDDLPGFDTVNEERWIFGVPAHQALDTRAPTIQATTPITSSSSGFFIGGPGYGGEGAWQGHYYFIVSGVLQDLPLSTEYTIALVRYGQQVNAELDQAAILQGQPITQRDSLVVLDPNPLGDPTVDINTAVTNNTGDTIFAQVGANPYIIGHANSDASGVSDFGIVISAQTSGGTPVFLAGTDIPPTAAQRDSVPFGRNDGVAFDLPRYNYVVMFLGQGVTGPTVARWQVAQDMDLNGQPLNNGFYPTPSTAYTDAELIASIGGAGRPDSISVEAFNAEPLAGSNVWQAWLVNRDESPITVAPATANYQRVAIVRELDLITGEVISETDSILETVAATSTFTGQFTDVVDAVDQEIKHRLVITDATVGGGSGPGFFTDVLFTQESGAATTPSSNTGIWFQYTDQNGTPTNYYDDVSTGGPVLFGHYLVDDPASSETFTSADWLGSRGLGGVRENEVSVEITNLPLPPIGFYYEGWLVGPDGNAVSLGPIKGLAPDTVSLYDADIDQTLPSVTATGIRFASVSAILEEGAIVSQEGDQYIINLSSFYLTLEPKLGGTVKNIANLEVGTLPTETIITRMRNP